MRVSQLQRLLLVPAFLAGELDPGLARLSRNAIGRAALAAFGFDAGVAGLDRDVALHRLLDQPLGLLAHGLLRHCGVPGVTRSEGKTATDVSEAPKTRR